MAPTSGRKTTRRWVLRTAAIAPSVGIAGCTGGNEPSTEPSPTSSTPTPTATTTPTATSTPEFAFPSGATKEGFDAEQLVETHAEHILDAGSATISVDWDVTSEGETRTEIWHIELGDEGVIKEVNRDQGVEDMWAPTGTEETYWRLGTESQPRYMINDEGISRSQMVKGHRDGLWAVLEAGVWSGAEGPTMLDGTRVVEYTTSEVGSVEAGLYLVLGGDSVEEYSASVYVSERGLVPRYQYTITATDGGRTETHYLESEYSGVGSTSVSAPTWLSTAKAEGIQFEDGLSSDGRYVMMELVNGGPLGTDADVSLTTESSEGFDFLPAPVNVGDTIYLSFDEAGGFLIGVNEKPSDAVALDSEWFYVDMVRGDFLIYNDLFE